MIPGILLAAGQGERFGADKLLVAAAGLPLICHSLKSCLDSRLTEVVVILGAKRFNMEYEICRHFPDETRIRLVENADYIRGMMSSLKAGIESVDKRSFGVMVVLADMPLVTTEIIDSMIELFDRTRDIILPECEGEDFHPRILPARLFPEFLSLGDNEKGTVVLDRHRRSVRRVEYKDRELFLDIDCPDDFVAVSRILASRKSP